MTKTRKISSFFKYFFRFLGVTLGLVSEDENKISYMLSSTKRNITDNTIVEKAMALPDVTLGEDYNCPLMWLRRKTTDSLTGRALKRHISKILREKNKLDRYNQKINRKCENYSKKINSDSDMIMQTSKLRQDYVNALVEKDIAKLLSFNSARDLLTVKRIDKIVRNNDAINLDYARLCQENSELKAEISNLKSKMLDLKRRLKE